MLTDVNLNVNWVNKMWYVCAMEYYLALKTEGNFVIFDIKDEF